MQNNFLQIPFQYNLNLFFRMDRFHDKYDFVLSHEITSLFGLWLPYYEEQSYIFAFQRLNKYTTNSERMQA